MLPRVLTKDEVRSFAGRLMGEYRVAGPVEKDSGRFAFEDIVDTDDLRLDYTTTLLPARKYVMPQWETLIRFRRDTTDSVPVFEAPPTVLLGVHLCDLHGIRLLDEVFSAGIADPHYLERRKSTLIVAVDCLSPCDKHELCLDMRTIHAQDGFDLMFVPIGDFYHIEVGTDAGARLIEEYAPEASRPGEDEMEAYRAAMDVKQGNFRHKLPFDVRHLPELLDEAYDSLVWQAVSRKCLGCGACNLVCPTCYCFNVVDRLELNLSDGERQRHWDSCQLAEFARVAGGGSFRSDRSARLRHRLYRKGKFIYEAFGRPGCTGCGRCARHCPAGISLVEVYCQIAGRAGR